MPPLRVEACVDGCRVWISVLVIAKPTYDLKSLSSPPRFGMHRSERDTMATGSKQGEDTDMSNPFLSKC